jgi:hypothetical protein
MSAMIDSRDIVYVMPASFAQRRLWFLNKLDPEDASMNLPLAVRLEGPLDTEALRWSLNMLVERHETLRTSLTMDQGHLVQIIHANLEADLNVIDIRDVAPEDRDAECMRLVGEHSSRTFSLNKAPLLRSNLLCLGDNINVLVITLHHIVSDNWSMEIFVRELSLLYSTRKAKKALVLPPLLVQYADYAQWQNDRLSGERLNGLVHYWKQKLTSAPELMTLPVDKPRGNDARRRAAVVSQQLSLEALIAISKISQRYLCTPFVVHVAALKIVLANRCRTTDVVIGADVSNRSRIEVEHIIGYFVNQLVLRTDFSGDPTFDEVILRVKSTVEGALTHQELPFEKLVEHINPPRRVNTTPLFQVKISPQMSIEHLVTLHEDLSMSALKPVKATSQLDVNLRLIEFEGKVTYSVEYDQDLYHPNSIVSCLHDMEFIIKEAESNPTNRLSAVLLTLNDAQERAVRDQALSLQQSAHERLKSIVTHAKRGIRVEDKSSQRKQ